MFKCSGIEPISLSKTARSTDSTASTAISFPSFFPSQPMPYVFALHKRDMLSHINPSFMFLSFSDLLVNNAPSASLDVFSTYSPFIYTCAFWSSRCFAGSHFVYSPPNILWLRVVFGLLSLVALLVYLLMWAPLELLIC